MSTHQTVVEDKHAAVSFSQTPGGGAEETTVYIDKIITVREVTTVDGHQVSLTAIILELTYAFIYHFLGSATQLNGNLLLCAEPTRSYLKGD